MAIITSLHTTTTAVNFKSLLCAPLPAFYNQFENRPLLLKLVCLLICTTYFELNNIIRDESNPQTQIYQNSLFSVTSRSRSDERDSLSESLSVSNANLALTLLM